MYVALWRERDRREGGGRSRETEKKEREMEEEERERRRRGDNFHHFSFTQYPVAEFDKKHLHSLRFELPHNLTLELLDFK